MSFVRAFRALGSSHGLPDESIFPTGVPWSKVSVTEVVDDDARVRPGQGQGEYSTPHAACEGFGGDGKDGRQVTGEMVWA